MENGFQLGLKKKSSQPHFTMRLEYFEKTWPDLFL